MSLHYIGIKPEEKRKLNYRSIASYTFIVL